MGSGLALFPGLECALAFSQIEPIPVISVLYLTWAGFSCKSCRSETCDYAFAVLHLFSIYCSLIKPSDIPWFKSFFFPPLTLCSLAQGKQLTISGEATGSSVLVPYFWNGMCSVDTNCSFCFNFMEKVWRHNNRGMGKCYMQSPVFYMFVVASLQDWCIMRELWYTPIKYLRELALRHRQVGCWWRKLRW